MTLKLLNRGSLLVGVGFLALAYFVRPGLGSEILAIGGGICIGVSTYASMADGVLRERRNKRLKKEGRGDKS